MKQLAAQSRPFCFEPAQHSQPNTGATIHFRHSTTGLPFWVTGVEHARVTKSQAGTRTRPDNGHFPALRFATPADSVCVEVLACSLWGKSVPSYPHSLSQTRQRVPWWVYFISVLSDWMWHKGFGTWGWDGVNVAVNKCATALASIRVNLNEAQLFVALLAQWV